MHKIKIGEEELFANEGELLSGLLMKNGKSIDHPCGGRGVCGKCTVIVNGKEELSCKYKVHSDITVSFPEKGEITSVSGAKESGKVTDNTCFVLDIGTTTLALAMVSLDEKQIIKVVTRSNPQRVFGADIMSRIDYCAKNSVKDLNDVIIEQINEMIAEFGQKEIEMLYVSANTTMLHLFFNVDCSSIGVAPYTPAFLDSRYTEASELGLKGVKRVMGLPSISSFVGADLVSGLNYVGFPKKDKYNLLIDLGTNAEIILFTEGDVLCTAAAAGPCFEGANISCGMSATAGAIYAFSFDEKGEKRVSTISDAPAIGICGTGLIDVMAELVRNGTIDESGVMDDDYMIENEVMLSRQDIRQFQLAKSAVYSAIFALMNLRNVTVDMIEKMYISGGFSAKINIQNAVDTGLLPKELMDRCVAINNSSLLGAFKYACEGNDLSVYLDNAEYVDLSSDAAFTELFVENMFFSL